MLGGMIVLILDVIVMMIVAVICDNRLPPARQLPMQWGLDGRVNWYAPRKIALFFMPFIGVVAAVFFSVMSRYEPVRAGDKAIVMLSLSMSGLALLFIQVLHIYFVNKTLRKP